MKYVALLRGINVGGNNKVEMKRLKSTFEDLGYSAVSTYINSGNVFFETSDTKPDLLAHSIEKKLESTFGFIIPVVVKSKPEIIAINKALPNNWVNNNNDKADVMFLWDEVNKAEIIDQLPIRPDYDEARYVDGAILWHVERKNLTKTGLTKIIGTDLYKKMTIRNANTLRKLLERMQDEE